MLDFSCFLYLYMGFAVCIIHSVASVIFLLFFLINIILGKIWVCDFSKGEAGVKGEESII